MASVFQSPRRIHCVGIGGVGMSGIAEVLLTLGHRVSGSDMAQTETTRRLSRLGAAVTRGHNADVVTEQVDVVVVSSAVKYSNPEVVRARDLRIPVIPRAEMLAELMRLKYGVAVAGTHGKTTTTSLIATVLAGAGLDPTTVIGGKLHATGSNARLGQSDLFVAEADESDGTFLLLSPTIAVVTNIDPEHLDYYGDMDHLRAAYLEFINRIPFYGVAVLCLDSVNVRSLVPQARKRIITYGTTADADYVARELSVVGMETSFDVTRNGEPLGHVRIPVPGRHHALNALGAIAVAAELGVSLAVAAPALADFRGIHRRFELCGEVGGIAVVSDYAHHPEEIRATLAAAREGFGRRLVTVFQPHRFTRTRDLFHEFVDAFDGVDHLVLTDIYPAGEEPIEGLSGDVLHWALKRRGHTEVTYVPAREALVDEVKSLLRVGDMVLILGAGNIHGLADDLVRALASGRTTWAVQ